MEAENKYLKQFTDLYVGKTIMYVHGFGSSGQSGTVARIREVFPRAKVVAPDLPLHPEEAMALLKDTCLTEHPDLIIGTSMGGMYAEQLNGYDRILTNPALEMGDTMASHGMIGAQRFQNPRQDGVQEFIVTKALVKEYKAITEQCFAHAADEEEQGRVYGLFGDEDTTVNTRDLFSEHYRQDIPFHGGHRMNDTSFMHAVVPVMRWIDDRQEHRERPTVIIGTETMADGWGKPASSVQKTVRMLIERYNVYFVSAKDEGAWLEEYIGVPAWHHQITTHNRSLLLADYLIAGEPAEGSMATQIAFGTPQFKTWDSISEYFAMLGGQ